MTFSELVPSRYSALAAALAVTVIALIAALLDPRWLLLAFVAGAVSGVGLHDVMQTRHAILRNYPILAHVRYFFETIRPEIRQYLLEGDNEAVPFSRAQRSLVYQRAKNVEDRQPFGTRKDVYLAGYEWINHSLRPVHIEDADFRVMVGGKDCTQPYSCSVFNISAMSFGSLSANAVRALNKGAKLGGFAHDTGEGSYRDAGLIPSRIDYEPCAHARLPTSLTPATLQIGPGLIGLDSPSAIQASPIIWSKTTCERHSTKNAGRKAARRPNSAPPYP